MKPIAVVVAYDQLERFRQEAGPFVYTGFNCQILNRFEMEDGSHQGIEDMSDDEILDALRLAGATGRELERKGFKVAY